MDNIDIQLAKDIISEQFPELVIDEVTWIPEGGDSYTFDVNESIIFKFPISDESANRLVREHHALHFLSGRLPGYVAQPLYFAKPSSLFPHPFTGQRKLEGESGEKHRPVLQNVSDMAEAAGHIISRLHTSQLDELLHLKLPYISLETPQVKLNQVLVYKDLLQNENLAYKDLDLFLSGTISLPSVSPLMPVISHGDIKGEHVLVDNQACKISSIVSMQDAAH
jgi:hypothetical protein